MASAAPPSSPSSPQIVNNRPAVPVFSQDPEVDFDWEEPLTPGHCISMDDVMRRTDDAVVAAPLPVARAPEYTYYANLLCETCGFGDQDEDLLLCDGCDRGHHTSCLRPIVAQVPIGPWFCPDCAPPPAKESEKYEDVCEDIARISTPTVDTTINTETSNERDTGSSTIKNRSAKKRKVIHGGLGPNKKSSKADDDSIEFWDTFLAKRAFRKGFKIKGENQPPPFIEIGGFYVTYDEFFESFKARGLIANSVMTLWSNQFNFDQRQKFEDGKTSDRKFAFSQLIMGYLSVDSASFDREESCKKTYTKINRTFPFINIDLMFFPMLVEKHWVLLCVSMSMGQIALFDSLSASGTSSFIKKCAENLILNFAVTTMKYGFLKQDVSGFEWSFPSGYPKQETVIDCGMYTMDYMDAWNGKEMVASSLEKGMVLEYRKHTAQLLLKSARNKVNLDDFVKKYNGQDT